MTLQAPATPASVQLITDRRRFLLGGGLVIGFTFVAVKARAQRVVAPQGPQPVSNEEIAVTSGKGFKGFAPDAFIRISPKDEITLIIPNVEMGQGVYTGEAMLIAEELEVDLDQVRVLPAPPNDMLYKQPLLQFQGTGGSTSIRGAWEPLRKAGAVARTLLVSAAAQRWKVNATECTAQRGHVRHGPSGRDSSYGQLVEAAGKLPLPKDVALKKPESFRLLGKNVRRIDTPAKTNGSALYGIDIMVPEMKFAAVASCPVLGGQLLRLNEGEVRKRPGVVDVITLPNAVAVIGEHYWAARTALESLNPSWDPGPNARMSNATLRAQLERASLEGRGAVATEAGNVDAALGSAHSRFEALYVQPFLCHAPMEPQAAVVHVKGDSAQVWCGTQVPASAQKAAAKVLGIPAEKVVLHGQLIGGAFGRKLETDYVEQAVAIAQRCAYPVKMVWSREQDTQHDNYRPMYFDRISAGLDANGLPVAWRHRVTGASVTARYAPAGMRPNGVDPDAVEEAEDPVYGRFPNMLVDFVQWKPPPGLVVSWWRGVGPTHSVFVVESFVDELAHSVRRDPYEYRRALLANQPRARAVLDKAAQAAGWGKPLAKGVGRGIIIQKSFGSFIAVVIEAGVERGLVSLRRIVAAVDCGLTVNPNLVKQQVEGGILFGLSAALYSEITFEGGRVQQSNFNDYRMLRLNETPPVEVIHVPTSNPPGGIGETGTTAAAPALTNAIFAATGVRLRELPVARQLAAREVT
jgi:isoquinoline 1-oxidoreductase beta subunit